MVRTFLMLIFGSALWGLTAAAQQPVTVTIELSAEAATHLEALRTSGEYSLLGPDGKTPELMYLTLEDMLRGELRRRWLGPLLDTFPTPAMETRLATIEAERKAIDALKQDAVRAPAVRP